MSPDQQVCDFCSAQPVVCAYPARDFVSPTPLPEIGVGSDGAWAACEECRTLIERGDRDALAKRAADRYMATHPVPRSIRKALAHELRGMHDRFWSNREGAPRPVTGGTS